MNKLFIMFVALLMTRPASAEIVTIGTLCPPVLSDTGEAEYKPGVDVKGKPVKPADLKKPVKPLSYPIEIPVEVDIIKTLGMDVVADADFDAEVTHIMLYEDGHIEYNGENISDRIEHICVTKEELEGQEIEVEKIEDEEEAALPSQENSEQTPVAAETNTPEGQVIEEEN